MVKAKKSLGQNFLKNKEKIYQMVGALDIRDGDLIIEIGPGLGDVTSCIFEKRQVASFYYKGIELDGRFINKLKNQYENKGNAEIINDNILDWLPRYAPEKEFKIIGSLPYYITSPIIHTVIKLIQQPKTCVFLVQKEVAEKISSKAPDSNYLSVFIQTFFDVEYLFNIPNADFDPVPKVDGGVIRLIKRDEIYSQDFIERYEGFLHKSFSSPRKMLNKVFTKEELNKIKVDSNIRPQNLNVEDWLRIYGELINVF